MDYIINGGNRLNGEIAVCGAKNCALPLLGASVLTSEEIVLRNCPRIVDIENMVLLLRSMGKKIVWQGDTITVKGELTSTSAPENIATLLRGSALILGGTVAKYNQIDLPLPGGCAIGARPMDIHITGLEAMGVNVTNRDGALHCFGKPVGAHYNLRFASVGATENLVCAAVLTEGETVLTNVATEPEVVALEEMLNLMGANISGVGRTELCIRGVKTLHGVEFDNIPDRVVAATYLSAVVAAGGKVAVTNCRPDHFDAFTNLLRTRFGLRIYADAVTIDVSAQPKDYGKIVTAPYPFFPTDMQSLVMSLAAFSDGGSTVIYEQLFENRLSHNADQLSKMGAKIEVKGNRARITGTKLVGSTVTAGDLRGGAGLVISGLNACGTTVVRDVSHINRGYLSLADNLSVVGADIKIRN